MNDNENILLRASEPSITSSPNTTHDRNSDAPFTMVANPPEERANEVSDNFESLTYVSSKGFFFQ